MMCALPFKTDFYLIIENVLLQYNINELMGIIWLYIEEVAPTLIQQYTALVYIAR